MAGFNHETVYNEYSTFEDYAAASNRQVMLGILWVSFFIELIYLVAVKIGGNFGGHFGDFMHPEYLKTQGYYFIVYGLFWLLFRFFYDKHPQSVSIIGLFFILFQKLGFFINHPDSMTILVVWMILVMVLTWRYSTPWTFLPVGGFSYTYLIYGLLNNQVDISPFAPYLWAMMVTLILSSVMGIRNFKREQYNFSYQDQLRQANVQNEQQLNIDELTGLSTKHALDRFVERLDSSRPSHKSYVVMMDLDDLKLCNQLFGSEKGDDYIQTFARIIKFLEKSEEDMVAKISGDDFMAVLCSYGGLMSLEKSLERYNQLLKEEFGKKYLEDQFIPNFSYGIAEYVPGSDFAGAINEARVHMEQLKVENKKYLTLTNSYLSNINYNDLFSTGPIVAIAWSSREDWPIAYVSENVSEFLGYSNELLLSGEITYNELIHPEDYDRVMEEVSVNLKQRLTHYEQTYRLKNISGHYIWVRDHSIPVWDEDQLVQINGTLYDITDTLNAEEEVREKSLWLDDIIEATNVGTWEWDILKDEVQFNDRLATMIGYTMTELAPINSESWRQLLVEEDRGAFDENMREHLEGRKPFYELECRVQHKNGSAVWIYDRGRIMKWSENGEPWIMIGSQSDITELKQTESMLYHSEKLNALGRLSGGIAHDMNNQLMMISSISELSSQQDTIESYKINNQLIGEVVDKSRNLMHQLLSFTKHHAFEPVKMDVVEAIQETVNILRHSFDKSIEIRTIMAIDEGYVEADRSVLDNVFINLSINAREAMGEYGQLLIKVDTYKATKRFQTYTGYLPEGDYIEIGFTDNGSGIERESLEKVFEPFYSTKEGGSGIGLSTAVSAVREHKGGIKVRSKKDLGSVFSIFLPMLDARPLDIEHETDVLVKKEQIGTALRVLIVDDEPVICQVLSDYLSTKGWQIVNFFDPAEALEYCATNRASFDCVILDILMPIMSGIELYDALRELNPDLPVLFLSGYSDGIAMNEAYKDKVIDFIQKPAKLEAVYQAIEAWCYPLDERV